MRTRNVTLPLALAGLLACASAPTMSMTEAVTVASAVVEAATGPVVGRALDGPGDYEFEADCSEGAVSTVQMQIGTAYVIDGGRGCAEVEKIEIEDVVVTLDGPGDYEFKADCSEGGKVRTMGAVSTVRMQVGTADAIDGVIGFVGCAEKVGEVVAVAGTVTGKVDWSNSEGREGTCDLVLEIDIDSEITHDPWEIEQSGRMKGTACGFQIIEVDDIDLDWQRLDWQR